MSADERVWDHGERMWSMGVSTGLSRALLYVSTCRTLDEARAEIERERRAEGAARAEAAA